MSSRKGRVTKLCADCQRRKARFKYRGRVKVDRGHVLCFQCWCAELNRSRARQLALPLLSEWRQASAGPGGARELSGLTARKAAHLACMLSHLRSVAGGTTL
jgi:hypothetical protein